MNLEEIRTQVRAIAAAPTSGSTQENRRRVETLENLQAALHQYRKIATRPSATIRRAPDGGIKWLADDTFQLAARTVDRLYPESR